MDAMNIKIICIIQQKRLFLMRHKQNLTETPVWHFWGNTIKLLSETNGSLHKINSHYIIMYAGGRPISINNIVTDIQIHITNPDRAAETLYCGAGELSVWASAPPMCFQRRCCCAGQAEWRASRRGGACAAAKPSIRRCFCCPEDELSRDVWITKVQALACGLRGGR